MEDSPGPVWGGMGKERSTGDEGVVLNPEPPWMGFCLGVSRHADTRTRGDGLVRAQRSVDDRDLIGIAQIEVVQFAVNGESLS